MTDITFADAHVALGFGDPGGLNPLDLLPANPVTDRWYELLPEMYRTADDDDTSTSAGWPLYGYMDAVASVLETPTLIANRIADGALTDPAVADDAWIPWLAQAVGVAGQTVAEKRTRLTTLITAPAFGSRGYLEILTQTFLGGTKSVAVVPAEPWGIQVKIRPDEMTLPGLSTVDLIRDALYATGRVPSGYVLQVITDQETWGQLATAMPTWAPGQGKTWSKIQTMGLPGSGLVTGGVRWAGTAAGHLGP